MLLDFNKRKKMTKKNLIKKFLVRVYTYDPYYESKNNPTWRVIDFEKEFASLEEAREFSKKFQNAEILKKFSLTAYSQGELQRAGFIWARDLKEAKKIGSLIAWDCLADEWQVEEV